MRASLLLLSLVVAACAGDGRTTGVAQGPQADSARAILSRVTPELTAQAFERLMRLEFIADVRTRGDAGGEDHRQLRNERGADGWIRLRRAESAQAGGVSLEDPVSTLIPGTPPYLAPRTRDRYRLRLLRAPAPNGRPLTGAEAVLVDPADEEPVRRVAAWIDAASGVPYAIEVMRSATSAIYDEAGRAGVRFQAGPDGVIPAAASARSRVEVPFGQPRLVESDIRISRSNP